VRLPAINSVGNDILLALRRRAPGLALASLCLLSACASSSLSPKETEASRFQPWSDKAVPYLLEDGDELDVKLTYSPEFSDRVQIAPDGMIHLQLVGAVPAAQKTPEELAETIRQLYAKELRRPDVNVVPRAFYSSVVYVGGEVQRPNQLPLRGHPTVMQLIISAGGLTPLAYKDEAIIIRRGEDGRPMLKLINLRGLLEGDFSQDIQVARYDIIYVPRTHVTDMDQWVDQWINQLIPFNKGFSYSYSNGSTTQRTVQ